MHGKLSPRSRMVARRANPYQLNNVFSWLRQPTSIEYCHPQSCFHLIGHFIALPGNLHPSQLKRSPVSSIRYHGPSASYLLSATVLVADISRQPPNIVFQNCPNCSSKLQHLKRAPRADTKPCLMSISSYSASDAPAVATFTSAAVTRRNFSAAVQRIHVTKVSGCAPRAT